MVLPRLALQRRRLFVVGLLSYLAGLQQFGAPGVSQSVALSLAGAGATLACGLTILVILHRPGRRKLCEAAAAAALLTAILGRNGLLAADSPAAMILGLIAATALIHALLYRLPTGRAGLRFAWTTRRRFAAPCPPAAAWARLVPDPANPAAHYSGAFVSQHPVPGQPDQVIQTTRAPDGHSVQTTLTLHEVTAPHVICYTYHSGLGSADYASGDFSLTIHPRGNASTVSISETVRDLSIATALELWFDDFGGEIRAAMQAALTGRPDPSLWRSLARPGRAETATPAAATPVPRQTYKAQT